MRIALRWCIAGDRVTILVRLDLRNPSHLPRCHAASPSWDARAKAPSRTGLRPSQSGARTATAENICQSERFGKGFVALGGTAVPRNFSYLI